MATGAVVFDIGGVLEITPPTGWEQRWARELGLPVEELEQRITSIWSPGEVGAVSPARIEEQTAEALGLDEPQLQRLSWASVEMAPSGM